MTKQEVRETIRQQKRSMAQEEIAELSAKVVARFLASPLYQNADAIYTYVSYNQEVITHDLIRQALLDGKKVAVPKIIEKEMDFYEIHSFSELVSGYQHILEPITNEKANPEKDTSPIMVMPGLAFDQEGHRIGYGGGFYDRYLECRKQIFCKCAFAFSFQVYNHLETKEFDVCVDQIVTPERIYHAECLHSIVKG